MARATTAAVRLTTGEREPCRLATTANLDTVMVDGVEKISGLKTIDGVTTEVGDRVLVKDQTNQTLNGIYVASVGYWNRAADSRTARTMQKGTTVHIQQGTANAGNVYSFQTYEPNIGTDNIVLALYMTDAAGEDILAAKDAAVAAAASAADDAIATAADRTQTGLDVIATAAGRVQTGLDADATAADRVQTGLDRVATGNDAIATAADRVQTGIDRAAAEAAAASINPANFVEIADTDASGFGFVVDEDNMASNSATKLPTQQSVKAYVDARDSTPLFILASGQSNMAVARSLVWSPSPRIRLWDYDNSTGTIGDDFAAVSTNNVQISTAFADRLSEILPSRDIYVCNIAMGGRPISDWLPGASTDMYEKITTNMALALSASGLDKVGLFLWWQGETDADSAAGIEAYRSNFESVVQRLRGETWFPLETPIVVFGVAPSPISGNSADDAMNGVLQQVVATEPDLRSYVYTGTFGASLWVDTLHPNAAGVYAIGRMAAQQFVGQAGEDGPVRNRVTGDTVIGSSSYANAKLLVSANGKQNVDFGIGSKLLAQFVSNDGSVSDLLQAAFNTSSNYNIARAGGTAASPTAVTVAQTIGGLKFGGYNGASWAFGAAEIRAVAVGNWSVGAAPAAFQILTTPPGSATPGLRTTINDTGLTQAGHMKSSHATRGVGYATGAGGAVTQVTSKSTGVTLNAACGQITMHSATLNAATGVSFTLTDSAIEAGDLLVLNHVSGGSTGAYMLTAQCAAGSATINVRNITGTNLSEAIVIGFAVIKAVTG